MRIADMRSPIVDVIYPEPPEDGVIGVFISPNDSLMERLQRVSEIQGDWSR